MTGRKRIKGKKDGKKRYKENIKVKKGRTEGRNYMEGRDG